MLPAPKQKRQHREAILERYSQWRLSVPPSTQIPDNVSALILSKLTPHEHHIVHLDGTAIVENIAARKLTAVQVLTAFAKAAVAAQDVTNCLTEIFIDEALERAKELDHYQATTGKVVGPLHGLPVSVKDHIFLKGYDTSTGYVAWANKFVSETDAVVVQLLRQAGAVLYVKTANPQSLLVSPYFVVALRMLIVKEAHHSPWKPITTFSDEHFTHSIVTLLRAAVLVVKAPLLLLMGAHWE